MSGSGLGTVLPRMGAPTLAGRMGVNMNLVRNHIIYYYGLLHERQAAQVQISLFDSPASTRERPIPPEVPDNYMVDGCEHSHRLDKSRWGDKLVWGKKGGYSA